MIAILKDDKRREMAMREELVRLHPGVEVIFFDNAPDMVAWLKDNSNYFVYFALIMIWVSIAKEKIGSSIPASVEMWPIFSPPRNRAVLSSFTHRI